MNIKKRLNPSDETLRQMVGRSIHSELGPIDALPPEVAARIRDVYDEFIPVYVEILRIRQGRSKNWQPAKIVINPELLADMQHFYSDYQDLARSFKRINRQVKYLLKIDRKADPLRFDRCVAEIVSGSDGSSLMQSLVNQ